MAHKLPFNISDKPIRKKFNLPDFSGRFGFSFFIGKKELFLGGMMSDVVLESVVRRRVIKVTPSKVRTYGFDPLGEVSSED